MPVPGFTEERSLCMAEKRYHMVARPNQVDGIIHPAQIRAPYPRCDSGCLRSCNMQYRQCRDECCGWWGPL